MASHLTALQGKLPSVVDALKVDPTEGNEPSLMSVVHTDTHPRGCQTRRGRERPTSDADTSRTQTHNAECTCAPPNMRCHAIGVKTCCTMHLVPSCFTHTHDGDCQRGCFPVYSSLSFRSEVTGLVSSPQVWERMAQLIGGRGHSVVWRPRRGLTWWSASIWPP